MSNHLQSNIVLKDGKNILAAWNSDFDKQPTIGETVSISGRWPNPLPGYGERATVQKIELDTQTNSHTIELEAIPNKNDNQRPVVTLNANFVPSHLHAEAEAFVRSRLDLPLLDWEESNEPHPIVRLHENGNDLKPSLPALQDGIRKILDEASELAVL